jgi:hypothetical protein
MPARLRVAALINSPKALLFGFDSDNVDCCPKSLLCGGPLSFCCKGFQIYQSLLKVIAHQAVGADEKQGNLGDSERQTESPWRD